jgi:hypothetical protein
MAQVSVSYGPAANAVPMTGAGLSATQMIIEAARARGVDPLRAIAGSESGGRTDAANPRSSARGLFQFIDPTWNTYAARAGYDPVTTRNDPWAQADTGAYLLADLTGQLSGSLGREPALWELYSAHFLGPGGAAPMLTSNPARSFTDALAEGFGPQGVERVLTANPNLRNLRTVGDFQQMMQSVTGRQEQAAVERMRGAGVPEDQIDFNGILTGAGEMMYRNAYAGLTLDMESGTPTPAPTGLLSEPSPPPGLLGLLGLDQGPGDNAIMGLAQGLLAAGAPSRDPQSPMALGLQGFQQGQQMDFAVAERERERAAQEQAMQSRAAAVANLPEPFRSMAAIDPGAALSAYAQTMQGQDPTSLMQNLMSMGLEPGTPEWNAAMAEAVGPASTTIDMYGNATDRALAERYVTQLGEYETDLSSASSTMALLDQMQQLTDVTRTGSLEGVRVEAEGLLRTLGIDPGLIGEENRSNAQALQAATFQLVLENAAQMTGVLSDSDIRLLQSMGVRLTNEPEANARIIADTRDRLIRQAEIADRGVRYFEENRGFGGFDRGYQQGRMTWDAGSGRFVTREEWISAAREANPGMTDEQIQTEWEARYGGR